MSLNFQHFKDTFAIILFIALIIVLGYFNGCNREQVTLSDTTIEKQAISEAESIIDSLLCEVVKLRNTKKPIETRIKTRTVYITEKSDTVRKLIKDSVVLAYVDTLETQIFDLDSLLVIQKSELLKLDQVIIQKDTIIYNKDLIIGKSEDDIELLQKQIGKQARKIKGLKFTAIAAPIAVLLLTLLAK